MRGLTQGKEPTSKPTNQPASQPASQLTNQSTAKRQDTRDQSQEPHQLNLASQSKVDGLVTVVAAVVFAKGQQKTIREERAETVRERQRWRERWRGNASFEQFANQNVY